MLNFIQFYVFLVLIPVYAYFSGKRMSDYKDFKYLKIPRKISWLFFVRFNRGKIPLNVAICQVCSLLYMIFSFFMLGYYIVARSDIIFYLGLGYGFGVHLFISVLNALYTAICDLVLGKKNESYQ